MPGIVILIISVVFFVRADSQAQRKKRSTQPAAYEYPEELLKGLKYQSIGSYRGGGVTAVEGFVHKPFTFLMGSTSLGRMDSFFPESVKRMGQRLYKLGGGDLKDLLGEAVSEEGRYNYGFLVILAIENIVYR